MKKNNLSLDEWKCFAESDLDSARILIKESQNYHIVVFHSQQSVEKLLKWYILNSNRDIPYIHDLVVLLKLAKGNNPLPKLLEGASYLMDLYSTSRYPSGDQIGQEEAIDSINIANIFFKELVNC